MVSIGIHSHAIKKKYRAHLCSAAVVFQVCLTALIFIPPLFIAFKTQGFWLKESSYREQPDVEFKHDLIVLVQGESADSLLGYSTFQNFNLLLGDKLRISFVQSSETDSNEDGRADALHLEVQIPLGPTESVHSLQLLLFFDYKLYKFASLQMESMAYIQHSSSASGSLFSTEGELKLRQKYPLPHKGLYTQYNKSVVDSSSLSVASYDFVNIFASYQARNVSTDFVGRYPVWKSGRAAGSPFVVKVKIHYPEETITYRPGFWQLIKFAWIQYLSVLLIFSFVLGRVRRFVFAGQLVTTVPQKVHTD